MPKLQLPRWMQTKSEPKQSTPVQSEEQVRAAHESFLERYPQVTEEPAARRLRSNLRLAAEGVPINDFLPVIEPVGEINLPSPDIILDRATALVCVALKGEGLEDEFLRPFMDKLSVDVAFTAEEAAFMADDTPDSQAMVQFGWRYASAHVLFWSLGLIEELGSPDGPVETGPFVLMLRDKSRDEITATMAPRSAAEVLDNTDIMYRYRWALTEASLSRCDVPAWLHSGTAMEWQWALNWLVRHREETWDEVSLDT